ncbi:hypothetical protein B0H15DRAFT_425547 [Mycena belliarum]|uniref:Linalool dehydratase/isomerase domain-containing protein n=1 Tax=Mycena belliarum TaxID=1033014 RepID=A0AAD6U3K0_9AGAR|nr:hypothetical protein B0H15DRAFT_425547 [Mycena belliae]
MAPTSNNLPTNLAPDFLKAWPALSEYQAGHLRHFHNIATAPAGEWPHMGAQVSGQEWLDALRYQLSAMAYAVGAAHYHRLPALRSVFKRLLEGLIEKMLHRDVWSYWYLTSQSGRVVDPDIKELRKPWADPVVTENIMYSGHLLLMVSLHAMLFNDDKYDAPDALVFDWDPIFWGLGPERFSYTRSTLQDAILKEMEREKWIGVCCEPNTVFIVCNQFPIIAVRYNDVRNGTNIIDGLLDKYRAAWKSKDGFQQGDGLFVDFHMIKQDGRAPARDVSFTAWACAFMNSWNPEEVHALYPAQSLGFLSKISTDGTVNIHGPAVGGAIRALVKEEGADPDAPATIEKARAKAGPPRNGGLAKPEFGYIAQWASEVADEATVDGLLRHADTYFRPTLEYGGLYYPRCDEDCDAAFNWTRMNPYTGNAAIGYARLNVRDGQRKMYEAPWDREHFARAPFVDGVDLSMGVDFLRGGWDAERGAMVITMRTYDGSSKEITPVVRNLPPGTYGVYIDNCLQDVYSITSGDDTVVVALRVGGEEVVDVVVLREEKS